jgi:hypothetical protein
MSLCENRNSNTASRWTETKNALPGSALRTFARSATFIRRSPQGQTGLSGVAFGEAG